MRILMMALITLVMSANAAAHQLKTAISSVLFNERTGNIEVMHRFYLHDAEHAIDEVVPGQADLHTNEASQAAFSEYVQAHFRLANLSGEELPLSYVGFQVDGPHFWVYQETPIQPDLAGLSMRFNALQEVWSDQQNMINVERRVAGEKVIQTVNFTRDDEWLTVTF